MASWEWKSADGWLPYDEKSNKKIAKAAKNNKTSVEITVPHGITYLVDLVNRRQIQKNAPTKTRRVRWNDGSLPRSIPKIVHTHTHTTTMVPSSPMGVAAVSGVMTSSPLPQMQPQYVQTQVPMAVQQQIPMQQQMTVQHQVPVQQTVQHQMPLQTFTTSQAPPPYMGTSFNQNPPQQFSTYTQIGHHQQQQQQQPPMYISQQSQPQFSSVQPQFATNSWQAF